MPKLSAEDKVAAIYSTLARAWGRQHWWPAKSRFECIVGAYLTQNTSWRNVEIAMRELRTARVLSVEGIRTISLSRLERLIFFFQAEDGIRDYKVTGVQTCALPI